MKRVIFALVALVVASSVRATTWATGQMTDPITGEKVACEEIMRYGSYIYQWPSKYDLVFWPLTDENWICLNPKIGYAAFNDDFEKLSAKEKAVLKKWLSENYKPSAAPKSHAEKLAWLEKVYRQRGMDDAFWSRFYRLMAYIHRGDEKKSLEYARLAMPTLKKKLDAKPEGVERIETLYLLGEYSRRMGKPGLAKMYFDQARTAKYKDEKGKEQVGHPYFIALIEDREKMAVKTAPGK